MSFALKNAAAAAIVIAVALFWVPRQIDPSPYGYDDSDYVYAAQQGFLANWSDAHSIPLIDFIRIGLTRGRDPGQRTDLSSLIRDSGDMNGYRHWHGPLYYYLLNVGLALAPSEYTVRETFQIVPLTGVLVIYLGCLWLWPGTQGALAGFLSSMLFLWSPTIVKTTEIGPHLLFGVFGLASLFCLAKSSQTGARAPWYAALSFAGLAFCTMELAFALILTLLIFGYLERKQLQLDAKRVGLSFAALIAPIALLWPASLYKLTFLQSYMAMAYLAIFRKDAWGGTTFTEAWASRLSTMPVEWLALVLAVVLLVREKKLSGRRPMSVFLLYGLLMLLATLRVYALGTHYMTPFYPPLAVFTGCALAAELLRFRPPMRVILTAAVTLLVFLDTARQVNPRPLQPNSENVALLAQIRAHDWEDKRLLVPQGVVPMLHYYFPSARLKSYLEIEDISARQSRESFDGVIYPDGSAKPIQ